MVSTISLDINTKIKKKKKKKKKKNALERASQWQNSLFK